MPRPIRPPDPDVQTLEAAILWLRKAWGSLPTPPIRLHARDIEDGSALGSHRFSGPMWRILTNGPMSQEEVTESVMCRHPLISADASAFDCPSCLGAGFYDHRALRYRSPMAAALWRLSRVPKPSPSTPAPIDYIVALYYAAWEPLRAARMLGLEPISADHSATVEAMLLLAIRQLHSRYSAGPVARVADPSLAQRNAEDAA